MGGPGWLNDEEGYEEEGAEPEEGLEDLDDPDVADDIHPSTAAPSSDVKVPRSPKRKRPVMRASPKRSKKRPVKRKAKKRIHGMYIP